MRIVINGDSRSQPTPGAGKRTYVHYLMTSPRLQGATFHNLAGIPAGKSLEYIRGWFTSAENEHWFAPGPAYNAVYILLAGYHDIIKQPTNRTAAQMFNDFATIMLVARQYNFLCIACTERKAHPFNAAQLAVLDDYNAQVRAAGALYDGLIDLDAMFPDPNDVALLYDKIHCTPQGAQLIARRAIEIVN